MARRIASELPSRPDLLDLARSNLRDAIARTESAPALVRCYREWLEILDRPLSQIIAILIA